MSTTRVNPVGDLLEEKLEVILDSLAGDPQPPTIITIVNGGTNKMRIGLLRKEILLICCGLLLIAGAVEVCAQSVPDSAEKAQPLLVGAQVPDVSFKNLDGSSFNLRNKASEKPIILIFYRGGW